LLEKEGFEVAAAKEGAEAEVRILRNPCTSQELIKAVRQLIESDAEPGPVAVQANLHRKMQEARSKWLDAINRQDEIVSEMPNGIPEPDGMLLFEKAGIERSASYVEYRNAMATKRHSYRLPQTGPRLGPARAEMR
jgi:hypothetical protein